MKRKKAHRFLALLLAVIMCTSIMPTAAFAAEIDPLENGTSEPTTESVPLTPDELPLDTSVPESEATVPADTPVADSAVPKAESALSDTAAAFVEKVGQLNQEEMISAANDWGLAHLAWLADKENAELNAALEEALAVQESAMETAYAADDLYSELTEEEQANDEVAAAFGILAAAFAAVQNRMDNPVRPDSPADTPSESEILNIIYHDLPDAPTGSYMGSTGLPVATGETKISIAEWSDELTAPSGEGRLDATVLNQDALTIQIEKQAEKDFAIVPIAVQVEYPAKGSSSHISLPENTVLLSYISSADNLIPASDAEAEQLLNAAYSEVSASAQGLYVKAYTDFDATIRYDAPDGTSISKTLHVEIVDGNAASPFGSVGATTYARPTPAQTTGRITKCIRGATTWLIWFNGEEAYCCSHGLQGKVNGCPLYGYAYTSLLAPGQKQATHEATQINIWGALGQLSLGLLAEQHTDDFASSPYAVNAATYGLADQQLAEFCYRYYDDVQMTIIQNYPDSQAAQLYVQSAKAAMEAANDPSLLASSKGYYTYIYTPPISGWQTIALIGPETDEEGEGTPPEYFADWSVGPQSAEGSFDSSYEVNVNKEHLILPDTIDGAVIEIEPLGKSGTIDGGSWAITPAAKQTVTTSGHTMDEDFHLNGGKATASWQLHYSVSKTSSGGKSGRVGPYSSQADANAAAAREEESARAALKSEAQALVDAAIATAKEELRIQLFRFEEIVVPVGFEKNTGRYGSEQLIEVHANSKDTYTMYNEEWGAKIAIRKVDSETGSPIKNDATFEIFAWDKVAGKYTPYGGYNDYHIVRKDDETYIVVRDCDAPRDMDAKARLCDTVYYSQRNEGKFIIVETKAPNGYYGDWTDTTNPAVPGSVGGKRAYAVQLTKENNKTQILIDNNDYNADIALGNEGGTLLHTADGDFTIHFHDTKKPADRHYQTDPSGIAANENEYTMHPQSDYFQNDRIIGGIQLTKNDLDAMRPIKPGEHGTASIEGAVYDLYAAESIQHPDGFTGTVDYSKILKPNGEPIWHTTILENGGWNENYLPILEKDHLVASAAIHEGKLAFANLYPGKYYLVERATGLVLPVDENGRFYLSGQYPEVNTKLERTGAFSALNKNSSGDYTDYVYKNQYSEVAVGRALDGHKTYDGYYLSYAKGYLCDEQNHYQQISYKNEAQYIVETSAASNDAVMKSGFALNKIISSTGESNGVKLEDAGFSVYLIRDLSKASQFAVLPDGKYDLESVLAAYRKDSYNQDTPKYDFSNEEQAIARTYENDSSLIEAYNATLTAAGDYANGKGNGWIPTNKANEYRLAEIHTNEDGILRVEGLPYGQYLVVESTVPQDVFQADPFIVTVDSSAPQSRFGTADGAVSIPSDSFVTFNVLDEELEGYLAVEKIDAETGKAVRLANTAFKLYSIDKDGNEKPVLMNDPASGDPHKKTTVFKTDDSGRMKTPEKLPLGKYRIVEIAGPDGFFNDTQFNVVFELTSERVWEVVGGSADGMDDYVIRESYPNHETLGKITIRKTGEVLTGFNRDFLSDLIDPWFSGMTHPGEFVYSERPLPGAEFTITAAEDIYTQDRQVDAEGNRTLWYAKGDVVAVVTTGDGTCHQGAFAPARTVPTYDFCSVIHTSEVGAVSVVLPLGSYHIEETKAPYGHTLSGQSYDVTLAWETQEQDIVSADPVDFRNEREKAKVGVYKKDAQSGKFLAGAIFNLYTKDDIYNENGQKIFAAGELVATSPETSADGYTFFAADIPMRGEYYGKTGIHIPTESGYNHQTNSGNYTITEVRAPEGYYLNEQPMDVTFTYSGQVIQILDSTCENKPSEVQISKRELTGDDELPGATLTIQDKNYHVVDTWITGDEPVTLYGLHFGMEYTLTESIPASGYALAESIRFKLVQSSDADGNPIDKADVYVVTGKDLGFIDHWEKLEADMIIMRDDVTKVEISKIDITDNAELPGAHLVIKDKDGKVIEDWISTDKPHYIEKLPAGEYTLIEENAPDGYVVSENIDFTVLPTGEIQKIQMIDDITRVKISKQDITNNAELPGAHLVIKDKDGKVIEDWISTDKPHYIEKLPVGDYILSEITAPNGYEIAEDVSFKVEDTGEIQTVVMKDRPIPPPPHNPPVPQTGDNSHLPAALIGLIGSVMGLAALYLNRKYSKKNTNKNKDEQ